MSAMPIGVEAAIPGGGRQRIPSASRGQIRSLSGEETTPVAALSWVLELPRDLGLRQDTTATVAVERSPLRGWDDRLDRVPDWPGTPTGVIPFSRLRFGEPGSESRCPGRRPTEPTVS